MLLRSTKRRPYMPDYRLFFHDDMGHIRSVREFVCADDVEAQKIAEQLMRGMAGELWERGRRVKIFFPDRKGL